MAAFGVLLDLAKGGHTISMNYVANCYAAGVAVEKNLPEALRWWRKGAAKGDTLSMVNIATEYRDGLRNFRRAKWWLKRAVVAGNIEANLDLAETYYLIDKIRYRTKIRTSLLSALRADDFLSEQSRNRIEDMAQKLHSDCRR